MRTSAGHERGSSSLLLAARRGSMSSSLTVVILAVLLVSRVSAVETSRSLSSTKDDRGTERRPMNENTHVHSSQEGNTTIYPSNGTISRAKRDFRHEPPNVFRSRTTSFRLFSAYRDVTGNKGEKISRARSIPPEGHSRTKEPCSGRGLMVIRNRRPLTIGRKNGSTF